MYVNRNSTEGACIRTHRDAARIRAFTYESVIETRHRFEHIFVVRQFGIGFALLQQQSSKDAHIRATSRIYRVDDCFI